jgi:phenylpropionate dioxygenase-like ring-hydroxylating dioxygenase large terminal subunit
MTFIRNAWYAAGWSHELADAALLPRKFLNEPVVLFRDPSGTAVALADRCPHRFVPLHKGRLKDGVLECGYHGLCFDSTGACVSNPHGDHAIPKAARVNSYRVVERDGILWIWMGDQALADEGKIRSFPQFGGNDPRFKAVHGYLHVQANYQLVSDNLLDLTHGQYVHPMFANAAGPLTLEPSNDPDESTVWARFMRRGQTAGKFMQFLGFPADKLGDQRSIMRWNPPSNLLLDVGITGAGEPTENGLSLPTAHMLTPETETTTHYLWSMARDFRHADEAFGKKLFEIGNNTFTTEDKPVIEAQQKAMGDTTDLMSLKPVLLTTDGPAVQARRVVQRLLDEERAGMRTLAE